MPEYMWIQDKNGHDHLEDDVLLAYTRGQIGAEIVLIVQQHCAKCTICTQKCAEYTQIGMTLQQNLTYAMPVYPSIVAMLGDALDSPVAASAALRQRRENKRRLRKQSARTSGSKTLRLFPKVGVFPLTVAISLVVLMVLLTYTLTNYIGGRASSGRPIPSGIPTLPVQPTTTQMPGPMKTVTTSTSGTAVGVTNTPAGASTPTGNAKPTGTSKPVIWICSSNADLAQSRLRICGKNFKAGDRVIILEVFPNISHRVGTVTTADVHGTINGAWTISNCYNAPIAVFAFNLTHATFTPPVSVNIPPGGCHPPNMKVRIH